MNTKSNKSAGPVPVRGLLLLLSVGIFWGINWPIMKIGMTEIPVFTFRAIVFVFGGLALIAMCRAFGYSLRVPRQHWPMLFVVSACVFTFQALASFGVLMTGSGRASVIAYTMPVWSVVLAAIFLKERITWRRWLSLGFGMAGIAILITDDVQALEGALVGTLLMMGTAITWAIATLVQKGVAWSVPTLVLVTWQIILGAIPFSIGAAFVDYSGVSMPGLWAILAVVFNIFIGLAYCFYAYFEVLRLFPVSTTTIGVMITPIVGIFSGALLLSEPLHWPEYAAMVLVVCAIGTPVLTRKHPLRFRLTPP